jgi:hypothetical protein
MPGSRCQGFQGAVTAGFSGVLEGIDVGNRPIGPWKPENPHESAVTAPWKLWFQMPMGTVRLDRVLPEKRTICGKSTRSVQL